MNTITTHPQADPYIMTAAWPRNVLRQRVAVNAAADHGWDGSQNPTRAQLRAAVTAYRAPIAGTGSKNSGGGPTATAIVTGLLTDPTKSPFVDQVAVRKALNFDPVALRGLTDMEWDAFGVAMHSLGDYAFGDRWVGDQVLTPGEFPRTATVDETRDERRKAFLSLPEDLTARVYRTARLAKDRLHYRSVRARQAQAAA